MVTGNTDAGTAPKGARMSLTPGRPVLPHLEGVNVGHPPLLSPERVEQLEQVTPPKRRPSCILYYTILCAAPPTSRLLPALRAAAVALIPRLSACLALQDHAMVVIQNASLQVPTPMPAHTDTHTQAHKRAERKAL